MPIQKPSLAGLIFFAVTGCLSASQIILGQNAILNGNAEAGAGSSVDLSNVSAQISSGVTYTLSGYLGGYDGQDDNAVLTANFMHAGSLIGTASIGPVTEADRGGATGLLFRTTSGIIPVGTTSIVFDLVLTRLEGSYDDGYADNLSFLATSGPTSSTPEPASIGLLVCGSLVFCAAACRRTFATMRRERSS